jgi:hypothetical protein
MSRLVAADRKCYVTPRRSTMEGNAKHDGETHGIGGDTVKAA